MQGGFSEHFGVWMYGFHEHRSLLRVQTYCRTGEVGINTGSNIIMIGYAFILLLLFVYLSQRKVIILLSDNKINMSVHEALTFYKSLI